SDHAFARHDAAAAVTRAGVLGMGLQLWPVSEEISANCLTSIGLPEHVAETAVRELVRNKYGVMLSGGQGAGNIVRIAHMGPTASGMYPLVGLAALGQALRDLDVSVAVGAGIEAALETLSSQSILAGSW
ncbi:MAG: alanine--glyoxylate aminotransferase family protein, partial [Actinobacteria bacterium]|nr:alanine--glyoxylate aminotransferase family protein [Actinomycetota bacterium]